MADPASSALGAAKVGIALGKASANPIKRARDAKSRRRALVVIIQRCLIAVEEQAKSSTGPAPSSSIYPEPTDKLAERIVRFAENELRERRLFGGVRQKGGAFSPTDALARLAYPQVLAALERWSVNALQDAWRTGKGRTPEEKLLRQQAKQVAVQFQPELLEALKRQNQVGKDAGLLVNSIADANDTYKKAESLHTAGVTTGATGVAVAVDALVFTNDRVVNSDGRPAIIAAEIAITAAAVLLSRARYRNKQIVRDVPQSIYASAATEVVIPWLVDLAVQTLNITGLTTGTFVQLASLLGADRTDRPGLLTQHGGAAQRSADELASRMRKRLDTRVSPPAEKSGDDTLVALLTILGDQLDRLADHSPTFSYEELAIRIGQTLNWLCEIPAGVQSLPELPSGEKP